MTWQNPILLWNKSNNDNNNTNNNNNSNNSNDNNSVVFFKNINLLRHSCFPEKFMIFSEAATGCVLWKKLLFKISQYSRESCKPAALLKTGTNQGFHLLSEQLILYWLFYYVEITNN